MKKKVGFAALLLLCSILLASVSVMLMIGISGTEQPFTGKAAEYCDSLKQKGFPEDYAVALTRLHLLHPTWEFEPLAVSRTTPEYTWEHVIRKETEKPDTNLISADPAYAAYRHKTNQNTYDSGLYQPSRETVEYFMDPRNFLNECDIFQFYDLSTSVPCSEQALYAVLRGTFMEDADPGNGSTYADYLIEIGAEIGIDPVYLAVKLRQEQGVAGSSPVISGTCGKLLLNYYNNQTSTTSTGRPVNPPAIGSVTEAELLALNGYYNPFNVGASGSGVFQIYQKAMQRAIQGSPSQSADWGGSPSWNTMWKGLYGGAEFIKKQYIDQYQSTVYLQKFNVDGRVPANNFWKQYMQNVSGALSEARTLYQYFAANDTLDSACRFLIPVYADMPDAPCPDPAGNSKTTISPSSVKYTTSSLLTSPERLRADNDAVFGEVAVKGTEALTVSGSFTHSYGIKKLEYSWDGETWTSCSENGTLNLQFSGNLPDYGEHILLIRGEAAYDSTNAGKKANHYFLCAALSVTVVPPPSVELTLHVGSAVTTRVYYEGTEIELPVCEDSNFAGWIGSDGSFLPSGGKLTAKQNLSYTALFLNPELLEGAALSTTGTPPHLRFYARLPEEEFQKLSHLPSGVALLSARLTQDGVVGDPQIPESTQSVRDDNGNAWRQLTVNTPELTGKMLSAGFSVEFSVELHYTDGTQKTIRASGAGFTRTAVQVASAALADRTVSYAPSVLEALRQIAQ